MFSLNDKVVYPGHGVAKVNKVIDKIVGGHVTSFYELKFINKDMTVLVPTNNHATIGIRPLCSKDHIDDIFKILAKPATKKINSSELTASNWNKRNKEYQCKLRSGDLKEISEIYRDLKHISSYKELSFGEKSLLHQTESLLAEEISLVNKIDEERAVEDLRSQFSYMQSMMNVTAVGQKSL